jgi:DNA-binding NarL/FixJ family response regulator
MSARIPQHSYRDPMSRREMTPRLLEVLQALCRGRTAAEAAHELGITERTIHDHRKAIMVILGARTITQLGVIAVLRGYVSGEATKPAAIAPNASLPEHGE